MTMETCRSKFPSMNWKGAPGWLHFQAPWWDPPCLASTGQLSSSEDPQEVPPPRRLSSRQHSPTAKLLIFHIIIILLWEWVKGFRIFNNRIDFINSILTHLLVYNHSPEVLIWAGLWSLCCNESLLTVFEDNGWCIDVACWWVSWDS